ncbi:hypothetical protein AAHH88_00455 [Candidatus Hodgkinia cicadicola]
MLHPSLAPTCALVIGCVYCDGRCVAVRCTGFELRLPQAFVIVELH